MRTIISMIPALVFALPLSAKISHHTIFSMAIGDSTRIIVATPADFPASPDIKYPMIIMLHGWSGDETQWENDADLQFLCDRYNTLLVLPDGGYDGWWLDPPESAERQYAQHLHDEIIPWMMAHYQASTKSALRGLLGLSMGGYGSFLQVFQNPGSYTAAVSLSGVMDITRVQDRYGILTALGPFHANEDTWRSVNPLDLAEKPKPESFPALLQICGWDDFTFPENQDMFDMLRQSGYSPEFLIAPGTHSHKFWKDHVETAVLFIVNHFSP